MTVLVTGATGFIGQRLVTRLREDGEQVRALVLPGEAAPAGIDVVRGDVSVAAEVRTATAGVDCVYHLAAVVGDWGDEARFEAINVGGTRNVLEAAAAGGVERVLLVSSIVVYGWQLHTRVCDEDSPRERGAGPYGRTKRRAEELALDFHDFGRVPVTVVRPGNVFGPGSTVWVDTVLGLLRRGRGLVLDGGEGDAVLAYVDNVVDLIVRAARAPHAAGRIYNANDGGGVSWARYLGDLAHLAALPAPRRSLPARIAWGLGVANEAAWRLGRRRDRPLITREAVTLLASREPVPIARAAGELGYAPPVDYGHAMERVAAYLGRMS